MDGEPEFPDNIIEGIIDDDTPIDEAMLDELSEDLLEGVEDGLDDDDPLTEEDDSVPYEPMDDDKE